MRKLIGRALVLAVLAGCLVVIPSPQRTRADWAGCDADRSARNDYCIEQHDACVWNSGTTCQADYNTCLDQSAKLHHDFSTTPASGCLFENGSDPVPLPVLDTSLSDCATACQEGAAPVENPAENFQYLLECNKYCRDHYPKP